MTIDSDNEKLDLINERIDLIEEKFDLNENSILKKLGTWGGIIALIVSVFVGSLEIYDKTVRANNRDKAVDLGKVASHLEKLSSYTKEIASLQANSQFLELNYKSGPINSDRGILLGEIKDIFEKHGSSFDSNTLSKIASENITMGNLLDAKVYAERAFEKATDSLTKATAESKISLAIGLPSANADKDRSRAHMRNAMLVLGKQKDPKTLYYKSKIYDDWIRMEAISGKCDFSLQLIEEINKIMMANQVNKIPDIEFVKAYYSAQLPCQYN